MLRRVLTLFMALAVCLILLSVQPAFADQTVPEFRLSDSPGGPEVTNFGSGIQRVYAIFRYQNAARTKVAVRLNDSAGGVMFEREREYSGSGQDPIEITGQMVYQNYFNQVATQGAPAVTALNEALAASNPVQMQMQASLVVGEGYVIRSILNSLSQYPVNSTTRNTLTTAVARMDAFVEAGQSLGQQLSDEELRSRVQQMKADLEAALQLAEQARSTGGDGAGFGFVDTPEGQSNSANLYVNGSLAQSIEFTVRTGGVGAMASPTPPPAATPTRTPTRATQATVVPSATQPPTRTATPPSARTATQTPLVPGPTQAPGGYPGPATTTVATAGPLDTPTGLTPTVAEGTPPPTVEEPGATLETPAAETPTVAAQEMVLATNTAPIPGATPTVPQRRATPSAEPAAPGTGLPLGTVGVVAGALILGLVALWFRRQV